LCRKKCSNTFIQKVAYCVVSKQLISSLNLLSKSLPFTEQEFEDVVVSLLLNPKIEFDISKVESSLFNMLGLVNKNDSNQNLDHNEKQKFYELARSPVIKLQKEYSKTRKELMDLNLDTDDIEWKKKKKELQDIQEKLNEARKNAAADIFERINSFGNMGKILGEEEDGWVNIDLHGLHVYEAKLKIDDYVLPILPVLKKIVIITGYGLHGTSGGILKESVKKYFSNLKIKCIESTKNKGALCIYSQ
jgi:DNA-nicking Smr family endonuclease